jgi:hypothetical protein
VYWAKILHLQIKQLNHFNVYLNKSDDWKKRIQVMFLVISMHHKGQGNHWSSPSWFVMRDPKGALQTTPRFLLGSRISFAYILLLLSPNMN